MLQPWQTAVIKNIVERSPNTRSFFLEVQAIDHFDFKAGQFVTLDLPINDRASQRLRSYSIASSPNNSPEFELVISHKTSGVGTAYLFENCHIGDTLKFRGPSGNFILPEKLPRDICMICTGTGIAPFRAWVQQLAAQKEQTRVFHLVFGARNKEDLLYYEELITLAKQHPLFQFHVTLSRAENNWNGNTGYVHSIYQSICEDGKTDMDFYLCGWKNMINDAQLNLEKMGYPKERVHLESYD